MGVSVLDQRRAIFENVERLRRAQHASPADPDIAQVRCWLERELGLTVSVRLAARLLGVSHSSLLRWINRGEIATVLTPQGRGEVPVTLLLALRAAVAKQRAAGHSHVLERVMAGARERAERLDPERLIADVARGGHGHRGAELRGLAYHRVIAPTLSRAEIIEAQHMLARWQREGTIHPDYVDAWERLLARPLGEVRQAITADDEHGRDLRQSSPLAGLLSEAERRRILDALA